MKRLREQIPGIRFDRARCGRLMLDGASKQASLAPLKPRADPQVERVRVAPHVNTLVPAIGIVYLYGHVGRPSQSNWFSLAHGRYNDEGARFVTMTSDSPTVLERFRDVYGTPTISHSGPGGMLGHEWISHPDPRVIDARKALLRGMGRTVEETA